ncbi:MAG: PSD1 and planctomycete cytochrome C domain-containing protein [Akkermansiaceae bacterium]
MSRKVSFLILINLIMGIDFAIASEVLSFNRDVRPILSDNCFACHGFDPKTREAGLRLDTREGALADNDGVIAIVPGNIKKSALWDRINSSDDDEVMPPPKTHKTLSSAQKKILRIWIEQGAPYEKHWSFVPPAAAAIPKVKNADWPHNPIDHFVLAKLEAKAIKPTPEASKETLIRRVTLDLTGLPPTLPEIEAFLADTSPDAYDKLVDRLLASPHYGERMAVDWLDAARYADTNGFQVDRDREIWGWRDWVIGAFNRNLPFDQFTIEQLAGDLLPNPTIEQRIATGFNRNNMLNEEGGIDPEEFRAEYAADRAETTAGVWLGLTFNCCRCHDHKYDPLTARDFYSMKAFFNSVPEIGNGNYTANIRVNSPPQIKLPAPEIEAEIAKLRAEMLQIENASAGAAKAPQNQAASTIAWTTLVPTALQAASGAKLTIQPDGAVLASGENPTQERYTVTAAVTLGTISAIRVEALPDDSLPARGPGRAVNGNFVMTDVRMALNPPSAAARPVGFNAAVAAFSQEQFPAAHAIDADQSSGWAIQPELGKPHAAVFALDTPIAIEPGSTVTLTLSFHSLHANHQLGRFRLALTDAPSPAATASQLADQIATLKKKIGELELSIPTTLVMEDMKVPRPTHILMRGAFNSPGERVEPGTPEVLGAMASDLPRNRLGLAKWLVDPKNPLTARVIANRFWQQVFGYGLVKTSEDFGTQGDLPSHPEMLDWLAQDFVSNGWNVKRLMKMLVTSSAYRQHSRFTPQLLEIDPDNRLLARGSRNRLMGEFIRDQALAISGLLVNKIGGPSVKPYHPPGLYEQVTAQGGVNTYVKDKGENLYRRSLYTYWKRSVPHPAMLSFGAPFREVCSLQRPRSNTPLQALNLMNDETYVEASRFLAARMMRSSDVTAARLAFGFRTVLARTPKPTEMVILDRAYRRAFEDFTKDPASAKAFLSVGDTPSDPQLNLVELAAFATVASTLLCMDETVTKP